jgi:hypothetical protein
MRRWMVMLTGILLVAAVQPVQATMPSTLSYQGVLQDGAGNPVPDGNYSLTFRIYNIATGGTALWAENQTLAVQDGILNAVLGNTTTLNLPFNVKYWLGISVAAEAELTPRVELTASPYAMRAARADSAGLTLPYHVTTSSGSTQFWITNNGTGTAAYFENTGGTTTPALYCQSGSNGGAIRAIHTSGNNAQLATDSDGVIGNASTGEGVKGYSTGTAMGVFGTNVTAGNYGYLGTPTYGVYGHSASGYAGYFDGNVQMTGFKLPTGASAGKVLTSDASGGGTWQTPASAPDADWTISGTDMYSGVSGNVGIGLTNPNRKLYVAQATAGLAYQLKLDNTNMTIGTSASGILFSAGGDGVERGKGALVYRCEDTWNRGSFHFLQNTALSTANPTMSDAVMTITNSGSVGIGTTSPSARLEVAGTIRASGSNTQGVIGYGTDAGVFGKHSSQDAFGKLGTGLDGVQGYTDLQGGAGVFGDGTSGSADYGVMGLGFDAVYGDAGTSGGGTGVTGRGTQGVSGVATDPYGFSGWFEGGPLHVSNIIEKEACYFVIDHPLDPENQLLQHCSVEAPEELLLYRGKVVLDVEGEASVVMPSYFTALVSEDDATVNLTPEGRPRSSTPHEFSYEWAAAHDRFTIFGEPGRSVAWLVMANRDDPVARAHPLVVEKEKGPGTSCSKGRLLNPAAYGYPESMGTNYERNQRHAEASRIRTAARAKETD